MGTQEPSSEISAVGAAFWHGFAFGDLVVYIPLLIAGLVAHIRRTHWGTVTLATALGITIYWPVVCLAAMVKARTAPGWNLAAELPYRVVCTTISAWGIAALILLLRTSSAIRQPHPN